MSEMGNERQSPENEQLNNELLHGLCRKFLAHNGALLEDALQRQALSAADAKSKGLKFIDRYTQETSVDTPIDKAIAVLLTRSGDWLRPGERQPHLYVYFPFMDSSNDTGRAMPNLLTWVEKIDENGHRTLYTVTEEGIQRSITHDSLFESFLDEEADSRLDYLQSKELFEEVKSSRLAVLDHFPMSA